MELIREFKPSILFLVKFIGLYLLLNFLYSLWIESYYPAPDPMSYWVTLHTDWTLDLLGQEANTENHPQRPKVWLKQGNTIILSVFEGCNGLNVVIIFLAFVFSFGQPNKRLFWFVPMGLFLIHLTNILRIGLLYFVTIHLSDYVYFMHKYLFTAVIYLVVFVLWYLWVAKWMKPSVKSNTDEA